MTQHTKGPWKINPLLQAVVDSDGRFICSEHAVLTRNQFHNGERVVSDEMKANAHLIAAAPDMLKALEVAYATLESEYPPEVWSDYPAIQAVINAINKAKGL